MKQLYQYCENINKKWFQYDKNYKSYIGTVRITIKSAPKNKKKVTSVRQK